MTDFPALHTLIYRSHASRALHEVTLAALLRKARQHNQQANLTGLLLFANRQFLQVLEGFEPELSTLYDRIRADPRHYGVQTLAYGPIENRSFPDWRMGYTPADPTLLDEATGFLKLGATPGLTAHPSQEMARFLRDFAQNRVQDA